MRTKTKDAQRKRDRDLRRKRVITAVVKNLEKTQHKLELGLKTLKKDLVLFRYYRN